MSDIDALLTRFAYASTVYHNDPSGVAFKDLEDAASAIRTLVEQTRLHLIEAEAVIVNAQDQLYTDHPVWVILDDYDGSMDSVKTLKAERDAARVQAQDAKAEVLRLAAELARLTGSGDVEEVVLSLESVSQADLDGVAAIGAMPSVPSLDVELQGDAPAPRLLHGEPFPPHDPRGWPEYQACVSDICAAFRQHVPECPASKATEAAGERPQAEITMRDDGGR